MNWLGTIFTSIKMDKLGIKEVMKELNANLRAAGMDVDSDDDEEEEEEPLFSSDDEPSSSDDEEEDEEVDQAGKPEEPQ